MFLIILLLLIGLAILVSGGEVMVRGSASLARKMKISPLVIGLTVVAFGTSAPELVVNIFSALRGSADIAIGNIIGSNISNIFLILGVCGLIRSLKVQSNTVWKEIPLALLSVFLIFIMGNDALLDNANFNILSRTDGLALMSFFFIFIYYAYGMVKKDKQQQEGKVKEYSLLISLILTILGIIGLFYGGKLLVDNAIILARLAGMSEALIGLTIVAIGTSLPELATSVIATLHGQDDIAIGNIIGSNIFNAFWILGLTATILSLPFNATVNFDVGINILAILLLFGFMFTHHRHKLNRWQGLVFVLLYVSYLAFLIQRG